MKRFKNILLSIDTESGIKPLIKRAADLAKNNKARLTIVQAENAIPDDLRKMFTSMSLGNLKDIVTQERLKTLKDFVKPIEGKGFPVSMKVLFGTPFIEITREVLRNKHDLVIRAVEGKGGIREDRMRGEASSVGIFGESPHATVYAE